MSARMIVTVLADGTIEAKTEGVLGADCLDYVSVLEDLVLGSAVSSEFTDDYHRTATATTADAQVLEARQVRSEA